MTYRIETSVAASEVSLSFQGLLDSAALDAVRSSVAAARARGTKAVVLTLAPGTTVDRECIPGLRSIDGLAVKAASRFLATWLAQCGVN